MTFVPDLYVAPLGRTTLYSASIASPYPSFVRVALTVESTTLAEEDVAVSVYAMLFTLAVTNDPEDTLTSPTTELPHSLGIRWFFIFAVSKEEFTVDENVKRILLTFAGMFKIPLKTPYLASFKNGDPLYKISPGFDASETVT